jgi:hypothetical protein
MSHRIPVEFVSYWAEGRIATPAQLDLQTGEVTDIHVSEDGAEFECLERETVELNGLVADVSANDENCYFLEDAAMLAPFRACCAP